MSFDRGLSDDFIEALASAPFWKNVLADRDLMPEVRPKNRLTIYYGGNALLREVTFQNGEFFASTHAKFVPVQSDTVGVHLRATAQGPFEFSSSLRIQTLDDLSRTPLESYKRLMKFERRLEEDLIHRILSIPVRRGEQRVWNLPLDQQIAFSGEELNESNNRIDFVYYDRTLEKVVFAEVKGIWDNRLEPTESRPVVIDQLERYVLQLDKSANELASAYEATVRIKRRLGLGNRLEGVPVGPLSVLPKPVLIIGGMNSVQVKQFRSDWNDDGPDHGWRHLTQPLRMATFGVILTGDGSSCLLDWDSGPQKLRSPD